MKAEKITRTPEQEQMIVDYIKKKGYKNVTSFAESVGLQRQNLWGMIKGRTAPGVLIILRMSNKLRCSTDRVIKLFYPNEYEQYKYRR